MAGTLFFTRQIPRYQAAADLSDLHLENEAVLVAWFVDQYRRDLDENAFREELGSFLGMLENIRYDDMSSSANYYSSIFVLVQTVAITR
ncbi:unnamed protein product [Strongylus vulgaris]|uniref:Uncharacterized protein n=1 Tax=Strongylus vulgaris TaxID=40348 RepID=A0A3P7IRC3_STRVU|nr:unnamed protein product [Strongylus vulgaris]